MSESSNGVTFKPNLAVKEALDHLAKRLDPIIEQRLAEHLGGQPWTSVLTILDERRGGARQHHDTSDLQPQLRMLTERLGAFGFPFDNGHRMVSTLGNELRIVRNQMAHMYDFTIAESYRASDFCVRLLEHFQDPGQERANELRLEALTALAHAEGVTPRAAASASTMSLTSTHDTSNQESSSDGLEDSSVEPEAMMLTTTATLLGNQRPGFEPWTVVPVGTVDVLDDLPKKLAKEKLRAVALEIVSFEGPIHLDRLVDLCAQSFGLYRVHESRAKKMRYQIQQAGVLVDDDRFVWPTDMEPGGWEQFRPNDSSVTRAFEHISPVELANAGRLILSTHPELTEDDFEAKLLQTFGRKRRTAGVRRHLKKVKDLLDR